MDARARELGIPKRRRWTRTEKQRLRERLEEDHSYQQIAVAIAVDFLVDRGIDRGMPGGQAAQLTTAERFISARRDGESIPQPAPPAGQGSGNRNSQLRLKDCTAEKLSDLTHAPFVGTVTRIVDEDTLKVVVDGIEMRVRLWGVDAPELAQPNGVRSQETLGIFDHLLPEQLNQRLTNPFIAACSALEVYSALSVLRREGGLHSSVSQLLERTLLEYDQATSAIRAVGEDVVVAALTEWLGEIHGQVEKEWNGEIAAGAFATSMVEGVLHPGSPEAVRQGVALLLSLQWDSDPARAIAWLESLEE